MEGNKITFDGCMCLVADSSAHLCHERSRLSMCSSGCVGRSLGSPVTGWCRCFPGCNRRTRLAIRWWRERLMRQRRGKRWVISNDHWYKTSLPRKNGKTCTIIYVAVKHILKRCPSRENKKQRAASSISLENGQKSIVSSNIKAFKDEEKGKHQKGQAHGFPYT